MIVTASTEFARHLGEALVRAGWRSYPGAGYYRHDETGYAVRHVERRMVELHGGIDEPVVTYESMWSEPRTAALDVAGKILEHVARMGRREAS